MRILLVSPRQFWPAAGGSKLRDYYVARALGRLGRVTCVFFRDPLFPALSPADLPFCERIVPVEPPGRYSPGRIVRGIAGTWPLPVLNYTTDAMMHSIRRELESGSYDAVHLEGVHLAAYAAFVREVAPELPLIVNWHNIESEGLERYADVTRSPLKRLYAHLTAPRMRKVESRLLHTSAVTIVCSEREREVLQKQAAEARIGVVENGVDTGYFANLPESGARNRIIFVGLMAYHANVDGAVWFTREIWPRVRERMPEKILTIVGANPVPAVLDLRREPGVEVTGTVPDVRPWYADAFASIVPLRIGAGTRLKILESMAAGVPVASTRVGAEGLAVTHGENICLVEAADEWVNAFSGLQDEQRRSRIITAGRHLVSSRYDWNIIGNNVVELYDRWVIRSDAGTRNSV